MTRQGTVSERLWARVDKSGECWLWTGAVRNGYGRINIGGNVRRHVHSVAYELLVGPIPEGLQLDHLCRDRRCVNPAHLEPVTVRENIQRGSIHANKTHCHRGHEFTPENTRHLTRRGGERVCRTCERLRKGNHA